MANEEPIKYYQVGCKFRSEIVRPPRQYTNAANIRYEQGIIQLEEESVIVLPDIRMLDLMMRKYWRSYISQGASSLNHGTLGANCGKIEPR